MLGTSEIFVVILLLVAFIFIRYIPFLIILNSFKKWLKK